MGRPQNFVSRTLWILMRFTNAVSAGTVTGGITWSATSRIGSVAAPIVTCWGRL